MIKSIKVNNEIYILSDEGYTSDMNGNWYLTKSYDELEVILTKKLNSYPQAHRIIEEMKEGDYDWTGDELDMQNIVPEPIQTIKYKGVTVKYVRNDNPIIIALPDYPGEDDPYGMFIDHNELYDSTEGLIPQRIEGNIILVKDKYL